MGMNTDRAVPVSAVPAFIERATAAAHRILPGRADHRRGAPRRRQRPLHSARASFEQWTPLRRPRRRRPAVKHAINEVAHALGGTFSAEHGIGQVLTERDGPVQARGRARPDARHQAPARPARPVQPGPAAAARFHQPQRHRSRRSCHERLDSRSIRRAAASSRPAPPAWPCCRPDGAEVRARPVQAHRGARRRRRLHQGLRRVLLQAVHARRPASRSSACRPTPSRWPRSAAMVDTKNYTWDMAKISQPAILLLTQGGKVYLEKHGLENDPNVAHDPEALHVAVRRRHQRVRHGARLPHRRVQGQARPPPRGPTCGT